MRRENRITENRINKIVDQSIRRMIRESERWPGDVNPDAIRGYQEDTTNRVINDCKSKIEYYCDKIKQAALGGNSYNVLHFAQMVASCAKLINDYNFRR